MIVIIMMLMMMMMVVIMMMASPWLETSTWWHADHRDSELG